MVQRSELCNEQDAGIKRWIRGESSPHRDINVVITLRFMTQYSCITFAKQCTLLNRDVK